MSPRKLLLLLCLASGPAALSCGDIASPSRSSAYEWRHIMPTVTGVDTVSFHWPRSRLPVRIWAEETLNLPTHVQYGIDQWESAFLYGEFRGVVVSDSNVADVIVMGRPASKGRISATRLDALAPQCAGATDIIPPPGVDEIEYPVRVFVYPRLDPSSPGFDECIALTTTHELGHAIGILAHSPDPADIMYAEPVVTTLSRRDQITAELAYHIEPTLDVPSR